ncbi:hypothetical protein AURDEDRAFT_120959 [Auricularia subglabra TFB-10046 SS5]|nr:hypothetical protein AURDEDRAFT_120959 [Auricularia subglabra TFB-10046 SS5]
MTMSKPQAEPRAIVLPDAGPQSHVQLASNAASERPPPGDTTQEGFFKGLVTGIVLTLLVMCILEAALTSERKTFDTHFKLRYDVERQPPYMRSVCRVESLSQPGWNLAERTRWVKDVKAVE